MKRLNIHQESTDMTRELSTDLHVWITFHYRNRKSLKPRESLSSLVLIRAAVSIPRIFPGLRAFVGFSCLCFTFSLDSMSLDAVCKIHKHWNVKPSDQKWCRLFGPAGWRVRLSCSLHEATVNHSTGNLSVLDAMEYFSHVWGTFSLPSTWVCQTNWSKSVQDLLDCNHW